MARSRTDKQMAIELVLEHVGQARTAVSDARDAEWEAVKQATIDSPVAKKLLTKYEAIELEALALAEKLDARRKEQADLNNALQEYGLVIQRTQSKDGKITLSVGRCWASRYESEIGPQRTEWKMGEKGGRVDNAKYAAKFEALNKLELNARTAIVTAGAAEFQLILNDLVAKLAAGL